VAIGNLWRSWEIGHRLTTHRAGRKLEESHRQSR
jgi:hypothetical protein